MPELPVKKYLLNAILISAAIIVAYLLYQRFFASPGSRLTQYLRDFSLINYTYKTGKYAIWISPTSRVSIVQLDVNGLLVEGFPRDLDRDALLLVEGNETGDLELKIRYVASAQGIEHTAYSLFPEGSQGIIST